MPAPRLADVPSIMITGKSAGNVVVDSLKAGAADFVVKPFDRDKLIAKAARWSRSSLLPAVRSLAAPPLRGWLSCSLERSNLLAAPCEHDRTATRQGYRLSEPTMHG